MTGPRLRSYKLTHDTGFAPNPFFGSLTLATCKPGIRRSASIGEWVAGFTSGGLCGDQVGAERLVYLMKVAERMSIAEYFDDPRFAVKRPVLNGASEPARHGDNIYRPLRPGASEPSEFEQLRNNHHWDQRGDCEDPKSKRRDIGGHNVLVAKEFAYFGRSALEVPLFLRPEIPKGQSGFGSLTHDPDRVNAFLEFVLAQVKSRVIGPPHVWPSSDETWRQ